jgi:hypothetical protein
MAAKLLACILQECLTALPLGPVHTTDINALLLKMLSDKARGA